MPGEAKPSDVMQAVKELREELDKKSPDLAKVKSLEETLEKQEEKNQQMVTDLKSSEQKAEELKERMDELEKELAHKGAGEGKNYKDSQEYKALESYVKSGDLEREEKALLRTDNDASGGYLVIPEMDTQIIKSINEVSNVRSIARVRTISSKSLQMPVRKSIPEANYEGEAEKGGDDASKYGSEMVTAYRQTVTIPITMDMLMDSAFNMEAEIMGDAGEAFAIGEGRNFVAGDGTKKPFGFLADTRVTSGSRETDSAGVIGFDDMMLLTGDLKTGYNPVYTLNRRTLAKLRTLKTNDGHPLWQPGMNGQVMNTINGYPYVILPDMPDIATGATPVAFGDFLRGYTIVDRTGMAVIRDDVSSKRQAIVEFTLMRWNTGQVVLPEAIKTLKVQ